MTSRERAELKRLISDMQKARFEMEKRILTGGLCAGCRGDLDDYTEGCVNCSRRRYDRCVRRRNHVREERLARKAAA